jgi:phospholipid-binding lipoprotein MlaA
MSGRLLRCLRGVSLLLGVLCLPVPANSAERDPLEGFNRAVFAFNEQADRLLMKPVAKGYKAVTPDPVESAVIRIFDNAGEVVNVMNNLLQGKFSAAANDGGRFLLNTTVGMVGVFDVAGRMGLKRSDGEDFGQTLATWGVGSGPYLVLPLLGPSTFRDAPSRIVDGYVNPINAIDHVPTRNSVTGAQLISVRAVLLDAESLISGDKYVFTRDVFLQRRQYQISDGQLLDSFGDDDYGGFDYGDDDDFSNSEDFGADYE